MSRPTIADVAREASVSKATVSRVLSGRAEYMRDATRQRVEQAIERLNYRPSSVARSLTSKRTHTAGILISDVGNPFYPEVIHGVEDSAFKDGYDVFLCNTNYDEKRGMAFVRSLIDKRVDGVLIMSSSMSDDWLAELARNNVPAVVLDWEVQDAKGNLSLLRVDYQKGVQEAVDHLIELGHRQFVHVSGPVELRTTHWRQEAFLNALEKHGIPTADVMMIEGNLRIEGGREAMKVITESGEGKTAVFSANDLMAMGILAEARALGIKVPTDMSVIGLDDIWLSTQTDPPLTTVALPRYEIGQTAMQLLFELLKNPREKEAEPLYAHVETGLTIRQSTGSVPG
ncbi:LacI family DNA-binding transcriptional regulator [Candidatus Leptofilum sp.]|uniref:LacI family DNA-binding transcriptional regulator n=1 Tax=Candidatus Leptofilum sp. TaxID=3241576 RepID=UPI003B5CDBB6